MGVLPNGPADISPEAKFGITGNDGSITGLPGRTQAAVTAQLQGKSLAPDSPWRRTQWPVGQMPDGPLMWSLANAFARSLLKSPGTVWADLTTLFTGLEFIPDKLTEHTEAIANLEDVAAATRTTPAYVSDLDDMATAPRFAVSVMGFGQSTQSFNRPKYQDILNAVDVTLSSTDAAFYGVTPTIKPGVVVGSSLGAIYYTPIVVDRVGIIDKIRWIVGADTSVFSIDYYEMALCVYNPDNGNIEKVWGSGNIKDAEASIIGSNPAEVPITMTLDGAPINQQCAPGQILFIAHQQTAPGVLQVARRLAVVPEPPLARTVPILDAWCYVAEDHPQGIPSSISLASLTRENRFIPWAAVSVNALTPDEEQP